MTKKVKIDIVAQDKTKKAVQSTQKGFDGLKKSVFNLKTAFAGLGAGLVIRSLVQTGKEVESLKVRFKFLFGSAQEGSKAFDTLAKFAGRVPFSLEAISRASGNLAVVAKDAKQLEKILEVTGNVAAATGLDFETTASQIQRAFAGGIASADIFREKGVRDMLGFSAGAKVSVEETIEAFNRVFAGDGEFAGTTAALAETFEGTLSMMGDKLFTFKNQINETFFKELKSAFGSLNKFFEDNANQTEKIAQAIGSGLATAVRGTVSAFVLLKDNIHIIKGLFAGIIAFKIATVFMGITTAIYGMRTAMIAFNTATKANIIFGGISLLIVGFTTLNSRLKDTESRLKNISNLDAITQQEKLAEAEKNLKNAQIQLEQDLGLTREHLSRMHVEDKQKELDLIKEGIALTKARADELALEAHEAGRVAAAIMKIPLKSPDEVKKEDSLAKMQDRFKDEETLLLEKFNKEKELVQKQLDEIAQIREEFVEGKSRDVTDKEIQLFIELNALKIDLEKEYQLAKELIADEALQKELEKEKAQADAIKAIREGNLDSFKKGKFAEMDMTKVTTKDTIKMGRHALQEGARINKEMFRLNQALNIGEAIMNTATGVTKALGMGNIPLAVAIGAMGAIQIATIAAQQPPAQFGGSRQQGTPFLVGEKGPELFTPVTAGTVTPNHQLNGGATHIVFNINTVDAKGFGILLDTRKAQIINMINSARNQKGQSNIV